MNNETVRINNETYFALVKQRLDAGDQVWIPIVGKSMLPFLRERDEVLLRTVEPAEVNVGDIVLAHWAQRYLLHRVVRKKAGCLWLAGDNNLVQLEKIVSADLIALLVEARRGQQPLQISSPLYKTLGMLWYYLRLPRRVIVGLKRRIKME